MSTPLLSTLVPLLLPTVAAIVKQSYQQCDIDEVDRLSRQPGLGDFVLIHPTADYRGGSWTVEGFSRVINHLTQHGEIVVLTGGEAAEDAAMIDVILKKCTALHRVINLQGYLASAEFAALIASAKLFIGVGSLSMHMAAALKTPLVALLGSSSSTHWLPGFASNSILFADDYRSPFMDIGVVECHLEDIPVVDVIREVENRLALLAVAG